MRYLFARSLLPVGAFLAAGLFDRSAISAGGAPVLLYSEPSYDITPAVQAEIAKHQPAAGPSGAPPAITVPNVTPAK